MNRRWAFVILILILSLVACDLGLLPDENEVPATAVMVETQVNPEDEAPAATPLSTPTATQAVIETVPTPTLEAQTGDSEGEGSTDLDPMVADYLFEVQPGSPIGINAWVYGCEWLGIAGQVFDFDGNPMNGLVVEAGGSLAGQPILGLALTSLASQYGPGGYEIKLLDRPRASTGSVWVQIKDARGQSLSPQIPVDTKDDCSENLTLLNFVALDLEMENIYYFPVIEK